MLPDVKMYFCVNSDLLSPW